MNVAMFLNGAAFMYLLGVVLLYSITESEDENEDPYAADKFSLLWPWVAIMTIIYWVRGENDDDDGTGTN